MGAQCATRERGGRFQQLGWPGESHAQTDRQRRVGIVFAWYQTGRALQVRNPHSDWSGAAKERSVRIFQSARQSDCVAGVRSGALPLERRRMDRGPPKQKLAAESD